MKTNVHCKRQRESSLSTGQGRRVNGHQLSAITTESRNVLSRHENENENKSENDRIRNRIDSDDYKDMVDIMEWEYTFCRCSRRCDVAECVTFYVVCVQFRYFSIV
jgi:hypothetical protein